MDVVFSGIDEFLQRDFKITNLTSSKVDKHFIANRPRYAVDIARTIRNEMLVDFATCEVGNLEVSLEKLIDVYESWHLACDKPVTQRIPHPFRLSIKFLNVLKRWLSMFFATCEVGNLEVSLEKLIDVYEKFQARQEDETLKLEFWANLGSWHLACDKPVTQRIPHPFRLSIKFLNVL
jgi:hypothetical protein